MSGNAIGKMILGTAQLGMDYGITNRAGKPSKEETFKILETAWNGGIKRYDTAPGYGSENIIGDFIKANGIENEIKILTKIPSLKDQLDWKSYIHRTVKQSFDNIGCYSIEALFFHDANDSHLLLEQPFFFKELLKEYPISSLGVSVYSPDEVEMLRGCEFCLAFQFPFNIIDRRFEKVQMVEGKRYARSIFLQGIISSENPLRSDVPKELIEIQKRLHDYFNRKKLSSLLQAMNFVFYSQSVDYILFGVDNKEQLDQILQIDLVGYYNDIELAQLTSSIDQTWLDPRNWN